MSRALVVTNLVKRYADVQAVRGVSFDVAHGEIFGLLGPNGAGKTTTLECIIGLRRPDSGSITIGGIDALREPKRARQIIGAQLQATALQDKITPREALRLFGSFYKNPVDPEKLIEQFQLGEKADAAFDTLSGGQRQRLAIALALVNPAQVIFLDEPTAGLDPHSRRELHATILELRHTGHTVLLTTHYIEEAQQLCDRLAFMDRGQIVAIGTPEELIAASTALSTVVVRTGRPLAASQVSGIAAVTNSQWQDGQWRLSSSAVTQTVLSLVHLLESESNELIDLQIHRPTLEDRFLELTGVQLADGA
jgi:ABC-2 type transport system ATP-binding protein